MARRKTPKNETKEEYVIRKKLERISGLVDRAAKVAWNRSMQRMQKVILLIDQINDKIAILEIEKLKTLDIVSGIRIPMVEGCIHPFEQLVNKESYVECKFCGKHLLINEKEDV